MIQQSPQRTDLPNLTALGRLLGTSCAKCRRRRSAFGGALCDPCFQYMLLPWWLRIGRRRP